MNKRHQINRILSRIYDKAYKKGQKRTERKYKHFLETVKSQLIDAGYSPDSVTINSINAALKY